MSNQKLNSPIIIIQCHPVVTGPIALESAGVGAETLYKKNNFPRLNPDTTRGNGLSEKRINH